jgi:hypothetical protein
MCMYYNHRHRATAHLQLIIIIIIIICRQKWRCVYIGVGPLSTIDVVQSKDTDNTSTWITKGKGKSNRCYISHRQLLNEMGITNGVTSFAVTVSLLTQTQQMCFLNQSPSTLRQGRAAGNFSASSQSLTWSRHFLATLYQLHSSLNTRSTCSYTVRFFYPHSALSDVRCMKALYVMICCDRRDDKPEIWLMKCDFSLHTPPRHRTASTAALTLDVGTNQF